MVNNVSKYSIDACCICIKETAYYDFGYVYPDPCVGEVTRCLVELDDCGTPYFTIYTLSGQIKCDQEWFSEHFKLYGGRR